MNTLAPFSVFYCGRNCNKTKSRVGLKRKRKGILLPPVTHHLKAATSSSQGSGNGEERIKERGRGGSAGESKYCCDSLIKVKGLSWVQTADLGLYCSPSYMRKFLKFVLSSCYWSSEGFFFSLGKSGKPTLIQAHFIPTISCWGGWLSCRQIIHGDFFLNEVKLLLSAKRVFQKSQPGFQLLPFFVLPPFVSRCGRVTWSRSRQALNGKRKSVLSGDFKLQGSFNYCELCAWQCHSSLLLYYSSFFQGLFLSSMLYSH